MFLPELRRFAASLSVVTVLIIQGCGQSGPESAPEVKAAGLIADSFETPRAQEPKVTIKKAALQKEFLLQSAVIQQPEVPMGEGLKSRVVVFHQYGKKVYLLEATAGHGVTQDLPQELILAVYPILEETQDSLSIDFNEGMSHLFTSGDWAASDMGGTGYRPSFNAVKIQNSRLAEVRASKTDTLLIRQIAQVDSAGGFFSGPSLPTVEVRYYLKPYRPTQDYTPVRSKGFDIVGFFETAPYLNLDGSTSVWATRFNPKKKIVFAISANTPAEYREAVRDGILYWNQSLPEALVEVIDAPSGVTAPDPDYNIIQWVPWDQAGFAYADGQMDPRTGETLHAQVYLTSAFAFMGKMKARRLLAALKAGQAHKPVGITLAGFQADSHCHYNLNQSMMAGLSSLLATNPEDDKILRASQDFVRVATAHEVGHTLGLRHNFAGSSHNQNFDLSKRNDIFKSYLMGEDLPESMIVASTVMDYPEFAEDVFMGERIRRKLSALPYDKIAIGALYSGIEAKRELTPAYCADSKLDEYADCKQFDFGSSLVKAGTIATEHKLDSLAYELLETFISAKAPVFEKLPVPVEQVGFDHEVISKKIMEPREQLLTGMSSDTRLLAVVRQFPYVSPVNLESVRARERELITSDIDQMGGIERVFAIIPKDFAETSLKKFEELLADPNYSSGVGASGKPYSFDANEKLAMRKNASDLLDKLPLELAKVDLEILGKIPAEWKITGSGLGDSLVTAMSARVKEYVMTAKKEVISVALEIPTPAAKKDAASRKPEDVLTRNLKANLPVFFYPVKVRKAAAPILKPGDEPDSIDWAFAERAQYKKEFEDTLSRALGCETDDQCKFSDVKAESVKVITPEGLAPEEARKLKNSVTRWLLENKAVLDLF